MALVSYFMFVCICNELSHMLFDSADDEDGSVARDMKIFMSGKFVIV
jgi:hypothetical protein